MLKKAAIFSLTTYFLHVTTWEGHIFHRPANWLRGKLPEGIQKPLFDCPICMTPWWGTLMYALLKGDRRGVVKAVLTVGAAAGMSVVLAILSKFYSVAIVLEEGLEQVKVGERQDFVELAKMLVQRVEKLEANQVPEGIRNAMEQITNLNRPMGL